MDLKPCPFCGGAATMWLTHDGSGHGESYDAVYVGCRNPDCGAGIKLGDYAGKDVELRRADAAKRWNRREP